jgi:hypothetical protein
VKEMNYESELAPKGDLFDVKVSAPGFLHVPL